MKATALALMLICAPTLSNAESLTGSCEGDGALASRLVKLREQGKTVEQAVNTSSVNKNQVHKFATLLWTHHELRSMDAASTRTLVVRQCRGSQSDTVTQQSVKPLSCSVKSLLAQTAAEARDRGFSRQRVSEVLSGPDSELTPAEAKAVLDVAFVGMKSVSPAKIGTAILRLCEQKKR